MSSEGFDTKHIGPYVVRGTIGQGAFSVVKLVTREGSRDFYACKVVPKDRLKGQHLEERFEIEIRINQQMNHQGIVQLYDLLQDDKNFYVVMEFCANGDLFQYIIDNNRLNEKESKLFVRQILETLKYVHDRGISHRDLKPENILIDQFGHVKLTDFGLSRYIASDGLVDTPCGSPCYASPECISSGRYGGKTTDMWSLGVIVYAMLTGQLPWTKTTQTQLFAQIRRGEYDVPDFLSKECRDFIHGLLKVDTGKRLTVEGALEHPWIAEVPPQYYGEGARFGNIVSIKTVDRFFSKEVETDAVEGCKIAREDSMKQLDYGTTGRIIKQSGIIVAKSTPDLPDLYGGGMKALIGNVPAKMLSRKQITKPILANKKDRRQSLQRVIARRTVL